MAAGALYLVATPLGNLEDITLRALRVLREVDLVACEDTRRTGRLLQHFDIRKPLLSCHDHNEARRAQDLAARALQGQSLALVSDAGTPAISDPGYKVVEAAIAAGVRVVPVPGPNAAVAALAASGLPTESFVFQGFLPGRTAQRRAALAELVRRTRTTVFFEAPHRILKTLADIEELLGDRALALARELTKLHEEFLRGPASAILAHLRERPVLKGEFVLLVGPATRREPGASQPLADRVAELTAAGAPTMEAVKTAAREKGIPKREAYAMLHGMRRQLEKPDST